MNKRITLLGIAVCLLMSSAIAQISITNSTPYTQNFNGLPNTGAPTATNPNPADWYRYAATTGAKALTVGNGSLNTGGFYSAGDTATATRSDRALGSLLSTGSKPLYFGAKFINNTGSTIVSATVSYKCEQWRRGNNNAGLKDTLLLDYATGTDSVHLGSWTNVPALTGSSVNSSTTTGALDGNTVFSTISGNITGMVIPNGATFWIRFNDFDVAPGSDDLLAVDDFSISFTTGTIPACVEPAASVTNVIATANGLTSISGSFTGTTADGYLVLLDSNATVPTVVDATTYAVNSTVGTATVIGNGSSTSFSRSGLVSNTTYNVYVFPYNSNSCLNGPNYKISSPGNDTAKTLVDACPEPAAPTNLVFTAVGNNNIDGKFNKSIPGADGYVVVFSTSSNIGYPLDSTNYSVGDSISLGAFKSKVGDVSASVNDTSFSLTGLAEGTRYYVAVIPYNNCGGFKNYRRTASNGVNRDDTTTTGTPPLVDCVQPTGVSSATIIKLDSTTSTISLKWKNSANGDSVLVFAAPFNTIGNVTLRDSVYYGVGSTIPSSGTTQPIVYYRGTDTTTVLTVLNTNTLYRIFVVSFNNRNCTNGPNYGGLANVIIRTAAGTDCVDPTGISNSSIIKLDSTSNSISIKWTNPANMDSVMVLAGQNSNIGFVTIRDSVYYAVNSTIPGSQAKVYYRGTDSSFVLTNLSANTVYKILLVTFRNKNCTNGPNYSGTATVTVKTALSTGVKYNNPEAEFSLFPNPTNTGSLFVKFNTTLKDDATVEVVDILGRKLVVQKLTTGNDVHTVDVSELAKGTYILNVVYKGTNNVSTFIVE